MNILILVTASISAYKMIDVANSLKKDNNVKVVLTENAKNFVTKGVFKGLSIECYDDKDEWEHTGVLHIELSKWADKVVLAPATANTIAKYLNGVTDNLVLSILRAIPNDKMIYVAPAMNTNMYNNIEQQIGQLRKQSNIVFIEPQIKTLACGDTGIGALASVKTILETIKGV